MHIDPETANIGVRSDELRILTRRDNTHIYASIRFVCGSEMLLWIKTQAPQRD